MDRVLRDDRDVDLLHDQRRVGGPLLGELDEALDHVREPYRVGLHALEEQGALLVGGVAQGVDIAEQRRHGRAEVVGERRVERVLGVLEGLHVGAVAGHLGVPGQVALVVVQRGDHHVTPEAGAVLAHAPARVLDPAARPGLGEEPQRKPRATVVVGVEHREAAADGLVGGVALDPLRSEVPGLDDALWVQGDDRVVLHLPDEQSQPLLAAAQPGLELVLLGQVAGDLGVPDVVAVPVETAP